jgi:hypothetical protein
VAELDPSIPLHGLLINRNDENLKQQRLQHYQAQAQQDQQKADDRRRLSQLIPQAMGYAGQGVIRDGPLLPISYETAAPSWRAAYDEARRNDPSPSERQAAMAQIATIDPELYMKLDEGQRKAVHDELGDMGPPCAGPCPTPRRERSGGTRLSITTARNIPKSRSIVTIRRWPNKR